MPDNLAEPLPLEAILTLLTDIMFCWKELPMEQMNLATGGGGGPDQHQTHLDR